MGREGGREERTRGTDGRTEGGREGWTLEVGRLRGGMGGWRDG